MNKLFFKLSILFVCLLCLVGRLTADLLPSWNEGPIKKGIIQFVQEVTKKGGDNYIPVEDRIAVFDEDGTLWVEQPLYTELIFAFDLIKEKAPDHPEWKEEEPFKSILDDDREVLNNLSKEELIKILAATHTGMSLDAFHAEVSKWIGKALHPRFKRPFTELIYQPMMEVMELLRQNEFDIYIVSGGGQEFMRSFAQKLYGISPGHVVGTAGKIRYEYNNGNPELIKLPQIMFIDDKEGKTEGINLIIGKRPVIAFGNSIGDRQMLEWTQAGKRKNFELLVHHDDAVREYAYGPDSKIGTFSVSLMEEAKSKGWAVVSMKNDWKTIFAWEKGLNEKNQEVK